MKRLLFVLLAIVGLTACGNKQKANTQTQETPKDVVEVIYFHGKQRCITCNAIEKHTKEVLENDFAQPIKEGKLVFKIVDISTPEGEKIADKYEVTWSSLYLNKWVAGEESRNNMTDFAFSYAKGQPDIFKEGLIKKINELLK